MQLTRQLHRKISRLVSRILIPSSIAGQNDVKTVCHGARRRTLVPRSRYGPKMRAIAHNHLLNGFERFEKSLCVKESTDIVLSLLVLFLETFHAEPFRVKEVSVGHPLARVL